jgi:hypothetical protein
MELAEPEDQVSRLQAFQEANPEITIIRSASYSSVWVARRDDELLVSHMDLEQLLDVLTVLVGKP